MTQKKTVTIPEVKNAYKLTGIKPVCKVWMSEEESKQGINLKCGCPMSALFFLDNPQDLKLFNQQNRYAGVSALEDKANTWAKKKYGQAFVNGFIYGVDSPPSDSLRKLNVKKPKYSEDWQEEKGGIRCGLDVKRALFS